MQTLESNKEKGVSMNESAKQLKVSNVYPWVVVAVMFVVSFASIGYTMASIGVYLPNQGLSLALEQATSPDQIEKLMPVVIPAVVWWVTLYGFGMAFVLLFTGKLWAKIDARILVTVGFAGQMIAVTLMSQYHEIWQFYVSGICVGLFGGLYYMIGGPFIANKWFAKKNGIALGVINAGTGAGGIINPLIIQACIDGIGGPDAWRTVELTYGIILLVIVVPLASILLRSDPAKKGLRPYGWTPEYEAQLHSSEGKAVSLSGVPFKSAIKSIAFWCLFLAAVAACFFGGFNNYYPEFTNAWGHPAMFGALLVSLAGICNFIGPITGGISDAIGAKKTTIILVILIALGWVGFFFSSSETPQALVIFFCLLTSVQMILVMVQLPLCAKEVFGLKDFERIWSTMMIGVGLLSSFAAPVIAAPYAATGEYYGSFLVGVGIAVVALLTILGMYAFGKKLKQED
jgi:MFS family permease